MDSQYDSWYCGSWLQTATWIHETKEGGGGEELIFLPPEFYRKEKNRGYDAVESVNKALKYIAEEKGLSPGDLKISKNDDYEFIVVEYNEYRKIFECDR